MTVAAQVHELARGSAHHELPATPYAAARHLVDDDVDRVGRGVAGKRHVHAISVAGALPLCREIARRGPPVDRAHPNGIRRNLGNEHPTAQRCTIADEELDAVTVDV